MKTYCIWHYTINRSIVVLFSENEIFILSLIFRYISLANTKHAEINDIHDAVSKSLSQIKSENEIAVKLKKQLEHEMVVLEERKAVSRSEDFYLI